jgi:hypothetical protein
LKDDNDTIPCPIIEDASPTRYAQSIDLLVQHDTKYSDAFCSSISPRHQMDCEAVLLTSSPDVSYIKLIALDASNVKSIALLLEYDINNASDNYNHFGFLVDIPNALLVDHISWSGQYSMPMVVILYQPIHGPTLPSKNPFMDLKIAEMWLLLSYSPIHLILALTKVS